MLILECLNQDADLFFEILNQKDSSLPKYFKHKKLKYHSKITCTITPKNTPDDGLYAYIRIDVRETIKLFTQLRKFKPFRVLGIHHSIDSRHCSLDHRLHGHLYISKAFVTNMRINWKVQQTRAYQKQLLDTTG